MDLIVRRSLPAHLPRCPRCNDPMVDSGGTHHRCLNCRYAMTREELRWRRQLAKDAEIAASKERMRSKVIPVWAGKPAGHAT